MKLDPVTGKLLWSRYVGTYVNGNGGISATSPAIAGDRIVIGYNGWVIAIDKMTGNPIWKTLVSTHPLATVHASPVIVNGHVFTGVSATEEYAVLYNPAYVPNFRGSAVSLNLATGAIDWQVYTVPTGYAGGGIWGSSPVVDPVRGIAYFTTGNNYAVPVAVGACIRAAGASVSSQRACLDPTDYVDSFVALKMTTGAMVWSRPTIGADAWLPLVTCSAAAILYCPTVDKPRDADFAQGASLFWVKNFVGVPDDRGGTSNSWVLGAGQKTSVYWALNPDNGGMFWSTRTATTDAELKFGSAVDITHNMVYTAMNSESPTLSNNLVGANGVPIRNWIGGAWTGMDTATGKIVFQIPSIGQSLDTPAVAGRVPGGLSVSNGVVFAGSTSGTMVAFDFKGFVHWKFNSGGVVASHPAIFNEWVYWSAGNYAPFVANQTTGIYAFSFQ